MAKPRKPTKQASVSILDVINRIGDVAVQVLGIIPMLIERFTGRWRVVPLGALCLYFTLLAAESYYAALGGQDFLYKPFIDGSVTDLASVAARPTFIVAVLFSIASSAVQAQWWRDRVTPDKAKRDYDRIKHHKLEDVPQNAIDLVHYRRKQYKSAGIKRARMLGFLFVLSLAVDVLTAIHSYPLFGNAMGANLAWMILSIFGAEMMLAAVQDALDDLKISPKVEVLD